MIKAIDRVISFISAVAGAIAAVLLVYILGHIIYEIVLRNAFDSSTFVLDEFVGYAVAAMTFLTLAHALDKGALIRVDLAIGRVRGRPRRWIELFCILASFAMTAFCAYWIGFDTIRDFDRGRVSSSIAEFPLWIPRAVVCLGLVLLMLQLFAYFLRVVTGGPVIGEAEER